MDSPTDSGSDFSVTSAQAVVGIELDNFEIYLRHLVKKCCILDSEVFGAVKSHSKRNYSPEGIYYDSRSSRFYDLLPIQEKWEDQESPDIGDFRSLASRSSVSGGSGYGSGVCNLTPDDVEGNSSGGI